MSTLPEIIVTNYRNFYQLIEQRINEAEGQSVTNINTETINQLADRIAAKVNILAIETAPGKSEIGLEQVQSAIEFAQQKPHLSSKSYLIITNAHQLSIAAQNKLLKLFEEPPATLSIILQTLNPSKLLITLRSRCLILDQNLKSAGEEEVNSATRISQELNTDLELVMSVESIVNGMLGTNSYSSYQELQKILQSAKDGASRKIIINIVIKFINLVTTDLIDSSANSFPGGNAILAKLDKLSKLADFLQATTTSNVNTKILADRIFLDLRAIV